MAFRSRRLTGAIAQRQGSMFETIFERGCQHNRIQTVRIPDGCKQIKYRLIRVKSPFDWILRFEDKLAFIDTKSTAANSISYSTLKPHQIANLKSLITPHASAGFVVFFHTANTCRYFDVASLEPNSSLKANEGIDLGPARSPTPINIFKTKIDL